MKKATNRVCDAEYFSRYREKFAEIDISVEVSVDREVPCPNGYYFRKFSVDYQKLYVDYEEWRINGAHIGQEEF